MSEKKKAPVPIVGDIWEEKSRPARTVLIEKSSWVTYAWHQRVYQVQYHTLTTPAKKASTYSTIADLDVFQKRFRKNFSNLEVPDA